MKLLMIVGTAAGTASSIFVVGSFAVRALEREETVKELEGAAALVTSS